MRTLIFNGSPRKNGDTVALLNVLKSEIPGEIRQVDAYFCNISPCSDCRWCVQKETCAIKDGMQEVYDYLENCNNVIIASPIYFSCLTGPLLSLGSRLQRYYAVKRFQGKNLFSTKKLGAVILCGGGDGSYQTALSTARCLLRESGCEYIGMAAALNTDTLRADNDVAAKTEVRKLAKRLRSGWED